MATKYRLLEARKMAGLTLREAAKGLEMTFQYLGKIEKEGCAMDSTKLIKFANFYKVSVDYLMPNPHRPKIELTDVKFFKFTKF